MQVDASSSLALTDKEEEELTDFLGFCAWFNVNGS